MRNRLAFAPWCLKQCGSTARLTNFTQKDATPPRRLDHDRSSLRSIANIELVLKSVIDNSPLGLSQYRVYCLKTSQSETTSLNNIQANFSSAWPDPRPPTGIAQKNSGGDSSLFKLCTFIGYRGLFTII